jgi:hypothetical protein
LANSKNVTGKDVSFTRRQLHVWGNPTTATKTGKTRYLPLIPELEQMLRELRAEGHTEDANTTVMRVFERQNSMTNAAAKVGMKRITHHDLRHLFATICIESGVDFSPCAVSSATKMPCALRENVRSPAAGLQPGSSPAGEFRGYYRDVIPPDMRRQKLLSSFDENPAWSFLEPAAVP